MELGNGKWDLEHGAWDLGPEIALYGNHRGFV
jgi:hypothetical protein